VSFSCAISVRKNAGFFYSTDRQVRDLSDEVFVNSLAARPAFARFVVAGSGVSLYHSYVGDRFG
jgi:hypothetical protein